MRRSFWFYLFTFAFSLSLLPFFVIVGRGGVQFPAVLVTLSEFVAGFQLLVVLVLHAERLADVVDDVLIGRRVVAAGRFLAGEERVHRIDIRVAAGDIYHPAAFAQLFGDFGAAGPYGRSVPVHVQGRGRGLHGFFERPSHPFEPWHLRGSHLRGLGHRGVFWRWFSPTACVGGPLLGRRYLPAHRPFLDGSLLLGGSLRRSSRRRAPGGAACRFGPFRRLFRIRTLPFRHRFYPFGTLTVWR